jgi:hypothetical protein
VLLVAIQKDFAAGWTEYTAFGRNSKSFLSAAEWNAVNLSCSCWQIPKFFRCTAGQNKLNSSCFCWYFAAQQNKIQLICAFVGKPLNFWLRGRTKCSQFELFLLVNSKIFAARLNKIQCFCSQSKFFSLRGWTKCSAFSRNS